VLLGNLKNLSCRIVEEEFNGWYSGTLNSPKSDRRRGLMELERQKGHDTSMYSININIKK
jgi:hypothetical protein